MTLTRIPKHSVYGVPDRSTDPSSYMSGLGRQAETLWTAAFGVVSLLSLLGIGAMATFSSERNSVMAAYLASFFLGFTLFGWRGLLWARGDGKGGATPWIAAALGAILLPALAVFFFEGIFPSL